ncbi:unnamed protein product [Pedinophyceae sp. YPF-701]|nr:unnamed protein product [Pedinophyceae sp. YPF-701]
MNGMKTPLAARARCGNLSKARAPGTGTPANSPRVVAAHSTPEKRAALAEMEAMKSRMSAHLSAKEEHWKEEARQAGAKQVMAAQVADDPILLVDAETYDEAVNREDGKLVLVDFFAAWCGPCKLIYPEVIKLAQTHEDKMVVVKFDCNQENKTKAKSLGIRSLPTFKLYRNGELVDEMTGAKVDKLKELVSNHL